MAESLVRKLAEFSSKLFDAGIPAAISRQTSLHIFDTLGVAVAGWQEQPVKVVRKVAMASRGKPEARVLTGRTKLPAAAAALVNGTMAHALDFDDTHLPSILHPSASVVSAALAAAELTEASGTKLVAAVALGNEITCRLGMAGFDPERGNSVFFEKGLHATSICGAIGSAAAVALLLGADEEMTAHAMAIAASMGSGLLEANRTGGSVKPVHAGWAAHSGVSAAKFAVAGLTGPPTVLEGRFGFFRAYSDGWLAEEALIGDLGYRWEVERLFIKPYPTNHFTHAGIDAAIALRRGNFELEQVTAIELGVPAPVLRTIGEPPKEKARPRTGHQAKFSGPFTVATALVGGSGLGVSHEDFTDAMVDDPSRLRLAALVRCVEDDRATEAFPHQFPAVLRLSLQDGSVMEHRVAFTRGGTQNPLSDAEVALKFRLNVEPTLGSAAAGRAAGLLSDLERVSSVKQIADALTRTDRSLKWG